MQRNNATKNRKSRYNPNRSCYLTADGRYYCYEYLDPDTNRTVTQKLEVGKDLSVELTLILDEMDHDADLGERYITENADYGFLNLQRNKQHPQGDDFEFDVDPLDTIPDPANDMLGLLFPEVKPSNRDVERMAEFIRTELTEEQRDLLYAHLGMGKFLEDIRREEEAATGKKITKQAMHSRWNRILTKACKYFGVDKPKQEHKTGK